MAPRVIIILLLTSSFFAVMSGLVAASLSKNLPTDQGFIYAEDGSGYREVTMRRKKVMHYESEYISIWEKLTHCPAWYSSREIHVLFKVWGWDSAAGYNRVVGKDNRPWRRASKGLQYYPKAFNTYRFKIYRLTADPVRIHFIDQHSASRGCGYLGRIPLVSRRNTAIDVITDLLHLPRIEPKIDLSPTTTPPRPPQYP